MLATAATIFVFLYPHVMISSTSAANSLTVTNASSSTYTLKVMTIVTAIFFPIVLIYQGWTFYVFRRRIGVDDLPHGGTGGGTPAATATDSAGAPAGR
jgi:cytochrome d ubiquinol oxidase subunit II